MWYPVPIKKNSLQFWCIFLTNLSTSCQVACLTSKSLSKQSAVANAVEIRIICSRETGWINTQTKCNLWICLILIALLSSSVLEICPRATKRMSAVRNNTKLTEDVLRPTASTSYPSQTSHIKHFPLEHEFTERGKNVKLIKNHLTIH